jgi:hypothetical protein
VKTAAILVSLGLGLGCSHAVFAQDAAAWLGAADCRIAPLQPAPLGQPAWNGGCKDGYADGKGVLQWDAADGIKHKLEATLVKGQVQGEATLRMPDGGLYIGTVRNGVPDGMGYFKDADSMQYEGEVHMGRRDGVADGLFPHGDRYKGQWKDGKPDGKGVMTYMLGGAYDGEWKNGKRDGKGVMTFAGSGRRADVTFDGGMRTDVPPDLPSRAAAEAEYRLLEPEARTGSHRLEDIAHGPVPLDLGFDELTPDQQRVVRARYPALDRGDDPPYPRKGPKQLYAMLGKIGSRLDMQMDMRIYVTLDADAKVTSVATFGQLDPDVRAMIGAAATRIKYTPARCGGKACPGVVPFDLKLTLKY